MAIGTATYSDSYYLSQSPVFQNRVSMGLRIVCNTISSEVPTALGGTNPAYLHTLKKNLVNQIIQPSNFSSWVVQFSGWAAADNNLISAATGAASNYVPITQATGSTGTTTLQSGDTAASDGPTPAITTTLLSNALTNTFNTFLSGA